MCKLRIQLTRKITEVNETGRFQLYLSQQHAERVTHGPSEMGPSLLTAQ